MRCACATPPVPEEGPAGEVLRPFDEVLRQLSRKSIEDTPFCKDISRLCRRLVIRNSRVPEEKTWEGDESSTVGVIADILLYVMGELEPEHCERVRRRLLDVAEEQKDCKEMEGVVSLMLEAVGGERSAAVRILKLINQGVILAAVEHLHYTVCKGLMTKDVRSRDGWRVVLDLDESRVQLHHIRREQSLDAFGDASDHFEFEYEVTCTFELSTASLVTGSLRIIRLDTAEGMSEERRSQLKAALLGIREAQSMASGGIVGKGVAVLPDVHEIFNGLYGLKGDVGKIVDEHYAEGSEFHDPLVEVHSKEDIKGQFRALRALFRAVDIKFHSTTSTTNVGGSSVVVLDNTTTYYFYLLPSFIRIQVRQFTTFELTAEGRIKVHRDSWNIEDLISGNVPFAGLVYGLWRNGFGLVSSRLTNGVVAAVYGGKATKTA